jgi:hypothetical protein
MVVLAVGAGNAFARAKALWITACTAVSCGQSGDQVGDRERRHEFRDISEIRPALRERRLQTPGRRAGLSHLTQQLEQEIFVPASALDLSPLLVVCDAYQVLKPLLFRPFHLTLA